MACKCGCGFDVADYELLNIVQDSADFFKHRNGSDRVRVLIKSGNRCPLHNRAEGGADNSQHLYAKAMDYVVETWDGVKWNRVSTDDLAAYLDGKYPNRYGIGKYWSGRVHFDVRGTRARWVS